VRIGTRCRSPRDCGASCCAEAAARSRSPDAWLRPGVPARRRVAGTSWPMLFNVSAHDPFSYTVVFAVVAVVSLGRALVPALARGEGGPDDCVAGGLTPAHRPATPGRGNPKPGQCIARRCPWTSSMCRVFTSSVLVEHQRPPPIRVSASRGQVSRRGMTSCGETRSVSAVLPR